MAENTQQTQEERLIEASSKETEKFVKERTRQRLESGQSPQEALGALLKGLGQGPSQQDTLQQVQNLAQTPVGTGERMGFLTSLVKGKGLSRPEKTAPLGLDQAVKISNLQRQQGETQRKIPQQQIDLLTDLLKLSKDAKSPGLFNKISGELGGPTINAKQLKDGELLVDPFSGELTVAGQVDKERRLTRVRQQEILASKRQEALIDKQANFNTTVGQFKQLVAQLKGGIEEGGAGSLVQGFYGDLGSKLKIKGLSRTSAIPGQIVETSLALNRILTSQNRVISGVVSMIRETLPTGKDPENFIASKVEQSLRNGFKITKAFEKAGLTGDVLDRMTQAQLDALDVQGMVDSISLTEEELAQIDAVIDDVLTVPATEKRTFSKKQPKVSKEEQEFRGMSDAQLQAIIAGD